MFEGTKKEEKIMAQWTKYNNPNRRRYRKRVKRSDYFMTLQELNYCKEMGITQKEYLDVKFPKKEEE